MNSRTLRFLVGAAILAVFGIIAVGTTREAQVGKAPTPVDTAAAAPITTGAINDDVRIASAVLLTSRYARSPLAEWNIRVKAAGPDCKILVVNIGVIMDDSMIEAMHYGAGPYGIFEGGVKRYYLERSFRGVAYKDASGKTWPFGSLSESESKEPDPCH